MLDDLDSHGSAAGGARSVRSARGGAVPPSRRALMRGVAWAAPAAAAMTAAPAYALSTCPSREQIDAAFEQRRREVSTFGGCEGVENPTFVTWYDGESDGDNGSESTSYIKVRNPNPCTLDLTNSPMSFRIDVVNLSGPDRNSDGTNTLPRRLLIVATQGDLSAMDASGSMSSEGPVKEQTLFRANGKEEVDGTDRTVYSARWDLRGAISVGPGEDLMVSVGWRDGRVGAERLTSIYRLVPLGVDAPSWSSITELAPEGCPDAYEYYTGKVDEWTRNGYGCSPNVTWDVATDVSTTNFSSTSAYTRTRIQCGTGIWSDTATDFAPDHDGIY